MLIPAKLPYVVDFLVRRGRTARSTSVWEDFTLSIDSPTAAEAPVVFRVIRKDGLNDEPYEIRSFDRRLWWPVLNQLHAARPAQHFVTGLRSGDYSSIAISDPELTPIWAKPKPNLQERFRAFPGHRILNTSRDQVLTLAHRGASQVMTCNDALYVSAGLPVYYGYLSDSSPNVMSLEAGCSRWWLDLGPGNRFPGPNLDERRRAVFHASVFDARCLDQDIALLEERGLSVRLLSKVEILGDVTVGESALEVCADSVLGRLFREEQIRAAFLDRIPGRSLPRLVTSLVPLDICRGILREIVEQYPPDAQRQPLKDAIVCAQNVLTRLGPEPAPSLTDEDNEALSSLRQ